LRVVGGKYRSRILKDFSGEKIRPTADKVKESLFNILGDFIADARVLDLFSGTGAIGIECLSRGAKSVIFTDADKDSLKIVKDNLSTLGENQTVIFTDAISFLEKTTEKFDFIFIDPPYNSDLGERALKVIANRKLLTDNGIAVFETEKENIKVDFLYLFDQRKYGRVRLNFFKYKKPACVFAGTFDPVTKGHVKIVERAKNEFEKVYLTIMVNPNKEPYFSLDVRLKFLNEIYKMDDNVIVDFHDGYAVDYLKKVGMDYYVRGIRNETDKAYEEMNESLSKKLYENIKTIYYKADKEFTKYSSSLVRECLENKENYSKFVPKEILKILEEELSKRK
jgi:16S rRNA (guanine(966)-N(2))-methyltransferase RsmD/pantetheine-phosphate adenylyltransferase